MNDDSPPSVPPQIVVRKRGGLGCFAKGCLTTVTVLMLLGVGIGVFGWFVYKSGHAYFTEQAVPTKTFEASDDRYQALLAKLQPLGEAMNEGRAASVELTADDLNTLIARAPQFAPLRGQTYVSILKDQLVVDLSFPLIDDPGPNQRFINARVTLDASYASGRLALALRRVVPLQGDAGDGLLPTLLRNPAFLQNYSQMLTRDSNTYVRAQARKDPEIARILSRLRTVIIKDNRLVATSVERPLPAPPSAVSPVATPPKME